jgi:hypothetical protein
VSNIIVLAGQTFPMMLTLATNPARVSLTTVPDQPAGTTIPVAPPGSMMFPAMSTASPAGGPEAKYAVRVAKTLLVKRL